mgnify:FL=1
MKFKEKKVNAKSTLSLMTLGVKSLDNIELTVEGTDEVHANQALVDLVKSNFKN